MAARGGPEPEANQAPPNQQPPLERNPAGSGSVRFGHREIEGGACARGREEGDRHPARHSVWPVQIRLRSPKLHDADRHQDEGGGLRDGGDRQEGKERSSSEEQTHDAHRAGDADALMIHSFNNFNFPAGNFSRAL